MANMRHCIREVMRGKKPQRKTVKREANGTDSQKTALREILWTQKSERRAF